MFMDRKGFYCIGIWDLSLSHDRNMVAIGDLVGILARWNKCTQVLIRIRF